MSYVFIILFCLTPLSETCSAGVSRDLFSDKIECEMALKETTKSLGGAFVLTSSCVPVENVEL